MSHIYVLLYTICKRGTMLTVVYLGVALRLPVKKAKIDKQNTNHDANKKGEVFYITISM